MTFWASHSGGRHDEAFTGRASCRIESSGRAYRDPAAHWLEICGDPWQVKALREVKNHYWPYGLANKAARMGIPSDAEVWVTLVAVFVYPVFFCFMYCKYVFPPTS